jgi:hypothetical protein
MNVIPILLLRLARHVAPRHRVEWMDAMQAELDHCAARHAVSFAAGCLFAALQERSSHMSRNGIAAAQVVCLAAAAVLAVLGCANAMRLGRQDNMVGLVFAVSGAIWATAFIVTAAKRWRALAYLACIGLGISAAQWAGTMMVIPAMRANITLIRAMALEGLVLFGVLLGAALLFRHRPTLTRP